MTCAWCRDKAKNQLIDELERRLTGLEQKARKVMASTETGPAAGVRCASASGKVDTVLELRRVLRSL